MCDSLQREATHGGSAIHESSHLIYDAAQLCSQHLQHQLETTNGAGEVCLAIEELRGRFNQWAAYVGAFAAPRASLDARLARNGDIRDMVLELLYMIQSNLKWGNFVDRLPRENALTLFIVNVGDAAEESSQITPGLLAIDAAMNRLITLSVYIRRSARRNHRLRQETRDAQDESLCRLLVQTRYLYARKSLCSQLGNSIYVRGMSLQYLQEHSNKLAYQRESQDGSEKPTNDNDMPEEMISALVVSAEDVISQKQRTIQGPETIPSVVSPSAISRIKQMKGNPSSTIISRGPTLQDGQRNEYEYPPQPMQEDGKKYQRCSICAAPLEVSKLTKGAWNAHVDQDLEPYVCISEHCIDPPRYFISLRDWKDHMRTRHSREWSEKIHTKRWYCDVDHSEPGSEPPEFDEVRAFVDHLKTDHGTTLTQSRLQARIMRNQRIATRDSFVCPLCDCVPPDVKNCIEERPYNLLWEHIAEHLKSLAFLSLSYIEIDPEDKASIADSSKTSDKDGPRISRDSLGNRDFEDFDDIPSTVVFSKCAQVEGQDFYEEASLSESENWDMLPVKSLPTDYEYLEKHLARVLTCSECSFTSRKRFELW
ncbi:MAG: hypothetical protein M1822_005743 [Bathelium mastoideum]|nr:MAG: hypothetical protein M1822_005743 [Bathelium mastoideum]